MNTLKYITTISGLAAMINIVMAFLLMTVLAGCTAAHTESEYRCVEYYPNGVDCMKTKKECRTGCDDFETIKPGGTAQREVSKQEIQQKNGVSVMQIVKGILHRVNAIGGETTGWAVRLDAPMQLAANMNVKEIEVAGDNSLLTPMENKHVELRGRLSWGQGIERGRYPVLVSESVQELQ